MNELGVYICLFNRIHNIPSILDQLSKQTFKGFDLHILNNNPFEKERIERLIMENKRGLNVSVKNFDLNYGPMIRFKEAAEHEYPFSVFLDDDEDFGERMMEVLNSEKREKTAFAKIAADFKDDINIRVRTGKGKTAKYVGPGGMIADSSVFKNRSFWERWKPEYYVIDDCWFSYFCGKEGWSLYPSEASIFLRPSGPDSMLKNQVIKNLKQEFVKQYNWTY